MREIKFRAWDLTEKVMLTSKDMYDIGNPFTEIHVANGDQDYRVNDDKETEFIPMQFTGLHDKNGKEIYEGDVIRLSEGHPHWISKNMKVVFYQGSFCIEIIGHDYHFDTPTAFITYFDACENHDLPEPYTQYIEVIGNVYENPDLLT